MKPTLAILAVAACVALITFGAGCISFNQPDLNGTAWKLENFGTDKTAPTGLITISFNDGNAAGTAGVNVFAAEYAIDTNGGKLTFNSITSTKMTGPANLMSEESKFLTALGQTATYSVSGDKLTLKDSKGTTLLIFGNPLSDSSWKLISYTPAGQLQSKDAAGMVTLMFDKNGEVTGNTGINSYTATWKLDGTNLIISQPTTTKMNGPDFMKQQEATYTSLLGSVAGFTLSADQLDLVNGAGEPVLSFVPILPGTSWGLMQINGNDVITNTQTTITFNNDGTFSGNAPVNTYTGQWKTTGVNGISLTNVASTLLISTDTAAVSAEQQIFEIMNTVTTYEVTDNSLTLSGKDYSLTFAPNYEKALDGTNWKLADNSAITVNFADGKIFGEGPVNTYSADITYEPYGEVSINNFVSTRMGGTQAQMTGEQTFFTVIQNLEYVSFSDGQLVLTSNVETAYAIPQ